MPLRCTTHIAMASALLAAPAAFAQDSIAPPGDNGLPGDALDAYRTSAPSEQVNDYAVDLAPIMSSWGNRYALGPIAKSSRSAQPTSANHLIAASVMAPSLVPALAARDSYAWWSTPGAGINDLVNSPPVSIDARGLRTQRTAVAFHEFGAGPDALFGTGDDEQNIIVARIDFLSRRPNRLLVSRVAALHNKLTSAGGNAATASFGLGAVDSDAHTAVLADAFGVLSPARLTGRNYVRVNAGARDPARVNRLQQSGANDAGATTRLLDTPAALTPPSLLPAHLTTRPALLGTSFASDLWAETAAGLVSSTRDHLAAPRDGVRGCLSLLARPFPSLAQPGDVATAFTIVRQQNQTRTRSIAIVSLAPDASVSAQRTITLPATPGALVDPADSFDPADAFPSVAEYEFTSFQSQAAFRGGAPVAGTLLPDLTLLVAAPVHLPTPGASGASVPQGEHNLIVVASLAGGAEPAWVVAAHSGDQEGLGGKPIRAGSDGPVIGRLVTASHAGVPTGPSLSAPAMDSRGNLYFLAYARLDAPARTSLVLVRANLHPGHGYLLELLVESGAIVPGLNSGRSYRLFLPAISDADSASSGAIWAQSTTHGAIDGVPDALPAGSPAALAVLAFRARLVYDVDQDGVFTDPEDTKGVTPDQSYHAVVALMPSIPPADFNRDADVNSQDFFEFLGVFFAGEPRADYNGSGAADSQDFFDFLADFFAR